MIGLNRRIERLEIKFDTRYERRVTVITLNSDNCPEDPYTVELPGGSWAFAIRGGPFTEHEIFGLRENYEK